MKLIKGTALLLIILPLLGSIFACLYSLAAIRGTAAKWETLASPPTTPVRLIRINYVETITGDIYEFQHSEQCPKRCWVKVDAVPPLSDSPETIFIEDCEDTFNIPSVKRFSDSAIQCTLWGTAVRVEIQAIDHNGNMQTWQERFGNSGDPLMLYYFPIIGAVGGFFLALLFFVIALVRGLIIHWPGRSRRPARRVSSSCSPTQRALDWWESARFQALCVALSCFR